MTLSEDVISEKLYLSKLSGYLILYTVYQLELPRQWT